MTRLTLLVLFCLPQWVAAHSFDPAILDIRERAPGQYDVRWKSPGLRGGSESPLGPLVPRFSDGCRLTLPSETEADASDGPLGMQLDCRPQDLHGQTIFIDGLASTRMDTIIRITWLAGGTVTGVANASGDSFVVPGMAGGVPFTEVLWRYGRLGVEHILGGYDHLLFVLGMLLLVERSGALIRTITAFTLAHSVTLACAVFGLVHVPPAPVEVAIALSIVLLATELARPIGAPATVTRRTPWLVAFGFGLLHGLGFAGALAQVGLPADQLPLALASFNGGVELGQLSFVLAMWWPVRWWRRHATGVVWRLAPAYAIGTVAMAWTLERVAAMVS